MPDFVILGKENCTWCDMAKELIEGEGFTYTYFDVTNAAPLRIFLKSLDLTTVPQIYVQGGAYVGGYQELAAAFEATKDAVDG